MQSVFDLKTLITDDAQETANSIEIALRRFYESENELSIDKLDEAIDETIEEYIALGNDSAELQNLLYWVRECMLNLL